MMDKEFNKFIQSLPSPLNEDVYKEYKQGIYDSDEIDVFLNDSGDFAFLYPSPTMDYAEYTTRSEKLGLNDYKKNRNVYSNRLEKIKHKIKENSSFIEIGAGDCGFLSLLNDEKDMELSCMEPDRTTKDIRDKLSYIKQFESFDEIQKRTEKYDYVGMFHVFEHINKPDEFLASIEKILKKSGILIIEIPVLSDPLLSIYSLDSYKDFYFQKQHPYIYTDKSLERVLMHNGFACEHMEFYQRYGIENHLNWIINNKPGGNEMYKEIFEATDKTYKNDIELSNNSDTVIGMFSKST